MIIVLDYKVSNWKKAFAVITMADAFSFYG